MQYKGLHDLFYHSRSSRNYFLSLPTDMQIQISESGSSIHTADDLHKAVMLMEKYNHAIMISDSLEQYFTNIKAMGIRGKNKK